MGTSLFSVKRKPRRKPGKARKAWLKQKWAKPRELDREKSARLPSRFRKESNFINFIQFRKYCILSVNWSWLSKRLIRAGKLEKILHNLFFHSVTPLELFYNIFILELRFPQLNHILSNKIFQKLMQWCSWDILRFYMISKWPEKYKWLLSENGRFK